MSTKIERISFGILTISDSCHNDPKQDKSTAILENLVSNQCTKTGQILRGKINYSAIVPDEESKISEILLKWSNDEVNVILTTGGTGFTSRDVTPEATKKVIERETPGISIAMLTSSLQITPMAMLSRAVSGICKKTLIINLPGSPKAVQECLECIAPVISHAVDLILSINTKNHPMLQSLKTQHSHTCTHDIPDLSSVDVKNVAGRIRNSLFPMVSMEEAIQKVKSECTETFGAEQVSLRDAHGRILMRDEVSTMDLPPFRASVKDGYAVFASDGAGKRTVLGGITAGDKPGAIKITPGTCVRVNTGSYVPDEATAVVQVEDTKLLETQKNIGEEKEIEILVHPKEGQDIREVGSDIPKGTLLLKAKTKLSATDVGILAVSGYKNVSVFIRPRVSVLSTGNELQNPGETPKLGHVYDSNKITLMTLLKENYFESTDLGIVDDNEPSMILKIKESLEKVDVIVTTGSVSMGEKDYLKSILQNEFGATIHFGKISTAIYKIAICISITEKTE